MGHAQGVLLFRRSEVRVLLLDLPADHQLDHRVERQVLDLVGADVRAVPEDRDAVADLGDLGIPVRDVHERDALFLLELADELEQVLAGAVLQHVRRLIEDDDLGLGRQGASDLHHLLLGDAQPGDHLPGVQVNVEALQVLGCPRVERLLVDHTHAPHGLHPEEHVACDIQVLGEAQLLVDDAETLVQGILRGTDRDRVSLDQDLARIGLVCATQNLDQGALAGSILAEQDVDFARAKLEIDTVQCQHTGKCLDDVPHLDDEVG